VAKVTLTFVKNSVMCKKGSKLNSILNGNCPRCQSESMYINKNPFNILTAAKMHEKCSHCGQHYMIEPGFFYGAMYVSYAVGIAFGFAAFVISYWFIGTSLLNAFFAIVGTLVVFYGVIMRISRNIWINIFVSYEEDAKEKPLE